jgi:polar amino acid transport system substrate-binding protein
MKRHRVARLHPRIIVSIAAVVLLLASAACAKNTTSGGSSPTGSGSISVTKDDAIAAEVPSDIASKGTLTVASDASYPPMEFFAEDNKTLIGADVDLAQAVATVLGLHFNVVNATFNGIIPGLQSGKYDLGWSSFFDNLDRQKVVDMVDYFQAGSGIFVPASNTQNYTSLDAFCGQAVAAESGTTELDDANAASQKCQSEGKGPIKALSFDTQNSVNLAVTSGRAVAGLSDTEVALYQTVVTKGALRFAGEYAPPVLYGIAVPRPSGAAKGSGPMTKPILDALQKLFTTGAYQQILQKWGIQRGALTAPSVNASTS